MKRRGRKFFRVSLLLAAILSVLYGGAVYWTGRALERSLAQISKPPLVAYHEALNRAQGEGTGGALDADLLRIARYQAVFERIRNRDGIQKLYHQSSDRREGPYHTWERSERDEVDSIIAAFAPNSKRFTR